jgi:hypothetical protein
MRRPPQYRRQTSQVEQTEPLVPCNAFDPALQSPDNQGDLLMKIKLAAGAIAALWVASATIAAAQPVPPPEQDVGHRHGNIDAAQALTRQAWNRLSEAQQDNRDDAGGHLRRAKELLDQASSEMKAAAVFINHNH